MCIGTCTLGHWVGLGLGYNGIEDGQRCLGRDSA
jgi:hypothetical protein